jgi:hypothetical protein
VRLGTSETMRRVPVARGWGVPAWSMKVMGH